MTWTNVWLTTGQDLYFHLNHPIKWVQVAGVVVAIDEFYGRRIYTLDDSSGATIECVLSVPKQNANLAAISATAAEGSARGRDKYGNKAKTASAQNAATQEEVKPVVDGEIDVGDILLVKGNITVFRNNKQIRVYKISHMRSTEDEVQFWKKMAEFYDDVLSKPWIVSEKELRRCRREATRSGEGEPREHKRAKRKAGDGGRTGLEKTSETKAKLVKPVKDPSGLPKVRVTGLEKAGRRVESVAEGLSSILKTRSVTPALDISGPPKTRITGLERKTKRTESVSLNSASIPSAVTITSTLDVASSSRTRSTGLERKAYRYKADDNQTITQSRTSTAPQGSDSRVPSKARVTGLERGMKPVKPSSTESTSDSDPEIVPPVRSTRAKVTGLEKKPKRVRAIHVEGRYDALGI
jgi:hypothetical protein